MVIRREGDEGWRGRDYVEFDSPDDAARSLRFDTITVKTVKALSEPSSARSQQWLAKVARQHPNSQVRRSAMVELRNVGSALLRPLSLLALVHERENQNLRETAIKGLGTVGTEEDIALLEELAESEEIARFGKQAAVSAAAALRKRLAKEPSSGRVSEPPRTRARFHVAISFAGEDRSTAERFAIGLTRRGLEVFYDREHQHALVGENLGLLLPKIYGELSLFCLVIVSKHYAYKPWPRVELTAILEHQIFGSSNKLIPVRLDATPIDGIPRTTGYIDLTEIDLDDAIEIVFRKVDDYLNGRALSGA